MTTQGCTFNSHVFHLPQWVPLLPIVFSEIEGKNNDTLLLQWLRKTITKISEDTNVYIVTIRPVMKCGDFPKLDSQAQAEQKIPTTVDAIPTEWIIARRPTSIDRHNYMISQSRDGDDANCLSNFKAFFNKQQSFATLVQARCRSVANFTLMLVLVCVEIFSVFHGIGWQS